MCCSRYTAFFKQRIPFWNKPSTATASCDSSGGSGYDNSGGGGDGKRATVMETATTATMAMMAEAVMTTAVTTSAAATMTAVTLVVSIITEVVVSEMAEKRDLGGGRVLGSRYTAFFKQWMVFHFGMDFVPISVSACHMQNLIFLHTQNFPTTKIYRVLADGESEILRYLKATNYKKKAGQGQTNTPHPCVQD